MLTEKGFFRIKWITIFGKRISRVPLCVRIARQWTQSEGLFWFCWLIVINGITLSSLDPLDADL